MPAEAKRFSRVDRSWIRSQKQSFEMKSVIQCCLGSSVQENTKRLLLKDIQKEIEICSKSLNGYLEKKRRIFPRYFFLSNTSLLTLLSQSSSGINSVKPFLSSLFNAVSDLKLEEVKELREVSDTDLLENSSSPTLFKATTLLSQKEKSNLLNTPVEMEISEVYSSDGEVMALHKRVSLEKGAEVWMPKLKDSIAETLKRLLGSALQELNNNCSIEDLVVKYPSQLCLIGCIFVWTREAEAAIAEVKNERRAICVGSKKFSQHSARLIGLLIKGKWPGTEGNISPIQRIRLESVITFCNYLRDVYDSLIIRKIKDANDFEWQKCFRVYMSNDNGQQVIHFLNELDLTLRVLCSDEYKPK